MSYPLIHSVLLSHTSSLPSLQACPVMIGSSGNDVPDMKNGFH
jgi:hypothetical protein